jgi:histidinol-phosphate aminotransferase
MILDPTTLFRANIAALTPYSTARDEFEGNLGVFLDANENPNENGYNRYPDPRQTELKKKLSKIKGIAPDQIFTGNGSDEAIDLCYRVFCKPGVDNVVAIAPSYGMYTVSAAINDIEVREVLLNEDFSLPTDRLLAATDANTKLMFICSPNNPTANSFDRAEIVRLIESFEGIVVLDEAYIDFAEQPGFLCDLDKYPNLIVLQTLSKAWGMAGLRVGLALADERVVELMSQVKYPYNINVATMAIVEELLTQGIGEHIAEICSERERVAAALGTMRVVRHIYPSDANFLLVLFDDADGVYDYLIQRGIIVRNRNRVKGCEGCLRITIGLKEENEKLIKSLMQYEEESIVR